GRCPQPRERAGLCKHPRLARPRVSADRPLALCQTPPDGSRISWVAPRSCTPTVGMPPSRGFYAACTVAHPQGRLGFESRYPHRRKYYRTTTWKQTGRRLCEGSERVGEVLLLARAQGLEPVQVTLPPHLQGAPADAYKRVELV